VKNVKGAITQHGLKYILDAEIYDQAESVDNGTGEVWGRISTIIESSDLLPSLVSFVVYLILAFKGYPWKVIVIASIIARIITIPFSTLVFVFRFPLVTILTSIYEIVTKVLVNYITIVLVSILVTQKWWVGIIFICSSIIIKLLFETSGGHSQKLGFNNRVAKSIITSIQNSK